MIRQYCTLGLLIASWAGSAAPWIDSNDNYLRQSLQTLAHAGIITGPINTYPLMWKNIAIDLAQAKATSNAEVLFALAHIRSALSSNQRDYIAGIKLKANSDPSLYQSFGETYFEQANISVFKEYLGSNWAAKAQINYRETETDNTEQDITYDGSYLAFIAGNWVLSIEQQAIWWGPGQQTALLLSNNARPITAVRLSRHSWQQHEQSMLSWLGPWQFSTFIGQAEHNSSPGQIKHFGARFNTRPFTQLELGISRVSQWGGDGLDNSLHNFTEMLLLDDSAIADNLAAVDITYHTQLFTRPISFYAELADDNAGKGLSKPMQLFGARTFWGNERAVHTVNLEWSDTYIRCQSQLVAGNCAYEGNIYPQGFRRYGRIIGSGYGADAQVISSSYRYQTYDGYSWAASLLHGQYYQPDSKLKNWQLRLEYRQPLLNGLLSVEGRIFDKSPQPELKIKRASVASTWEYRF